MDEKVGFEAVYTTFNKGTIAFIKSLFDTNDISYYVDNENAANIASGEVTGVMTVMVAKDQIDLVKELLKDIK